MGYRLLSDFYENRYVEVANYPKYVIPYTPIAIALFLAVALLPLFIKFFKKHALLIVSIFATAVFLWTETLFEKVVIFDGFKVTDVGSWQAYMCYVTPQAMIRINPISVGDYLIAQYSSTFKLHFYLIAIVMVITVLGIAYGFNRLINTNKYENLKPLIIQTISVAIFIGLCIFACFTAFYRTGELNLTALSSGLMSVFFIVFGITVGAYAGGLLYLRKFWFSRMLPSLIACVTTYFMYLGELVLMNGVLFKYGKGFLFNPIGASPFALIDLFVILLAGLLTYAILFIFRYKPKKEVLAI